MIAAPSPADSGEEAAKVWIQNMLSDLWDKLLELAATPEGGIVIGLILAAIFIRLFLWPKKK